MNTLKKENSSFFDKNSNNTIEQGLKQLEDYLNGELPAERLMEELEDELKEANRNHTSALKRAGDAHTSSNDCQDPEEKARLLKEMGAHVKKASEFQDKMKELNNKGKTK